MRRENIPGWEIHMEKDRGKTREKLIGANEGKSLVKIFLRNFPLLWEIILNMCLESHDR